MPAAAPGPGPAGAAWHRGWQRRQCGFVKIMDDTCEDVRRWHWGQEQCFLVGSGDHGCDVDHTGRTGALLPTQLQPEPAEHQAAGVHVASSGWYAQEEVQHSSNPPCEYEGPLLGDTCQCIVRGCRLSPAIQVVAKACCESIYVAYVLILEDS